MFNLQKSAAFRLLILCSFSLLLTFSFNPHLQKGYFSIKPNSSFSYEFPQTRNGTLAHYFYSSPSGSDSRYVLFDLTSGDAYPVLLQTTQACQIQEPIFQHIHYHAETDNLVYYCAQNSSLLFINQADHTVQSAIYLNMSNILPIAKLTTYGMNVEILAMDNLFTSNPQSSILVRVDMPSRQITTQIVFNQNLTTGEAVVAYTINYIATNIWQNNSLITKIYQFNSIGSTYQLFPIVNFTSSTQTITKFFNIGNYLIVSVDATVLFLNNLGMMIQLANIHTKELTTGVFHPAVVLSSEGDSLYLHTQALAVVKYTIVASGIFSKNLGNSQDMQIALANYTSNDLMFTYDPSGVFFNISDLQTKQTIRTAILSYNDLMLTNTTYTVVQNNAFYIFNLKTDSLVTKLSIPSSKYHYNKDQHIVTFLQAPLNSSCEVTHLDLISGKYWKTLDLAANLCPGDISYARVTDKGSAELVIPTTQSSFLIISETYGQIVFNTSSLTHETDSININFDDLSFYYYMSNQALKLINAYYYTFNPQSQQFQLNDTKPLKARPVESDGLFTINQNLTVGLSQATFTIIDQIDTQWFKIYANQFNLVTGFEDQSGTPHMFFSYVSNNSFYPFLCSPMIYSNDGAEILIPERRASTTSGQATGIRSFALYDMIYTSVGVVRFFNSDPQQGSKTLISI